MLKHSVALIAILAAAGACKKKESSTADKSAATSAGDKGAMKPAETKPAAPPPVVNAGPAPSNDKAMLGLELAPMGKWKPTWDAGAKVAKWENEDYMTGIGIRIVTDKLEGLADLKEAAPMMLQLGTPITKVVEEGKTPQGWWAIVENNDGKTTEMVYMQKLSGVQLVCSGNLTKRADPTSAGGIPKADVLTACESIKVKP
jgi:hypothetical protein